VELQAGQTKTSTVKVTDTYNTYNIKATALIDKKQAPPEQESGSALPPSEGEPMQP